MNKRIRKKQLQRTLGSKVITYREIRKRRKNLLGMADKKLLAARNTPAFLQVLREYFQAEALIPNNGLPAQYC